MLQLPSNHLIAHHAHAMRIRDHHRPVQKSRLGNPGRPSHLPISIFGKPPSKHRIHRRLPPRKNSSHSSPHRPFPHLQLSLARNNCPVPNLHTLHIRNRIKRPRCALKRHSQIPRPLRERTRRHTKNHHEHKNQRRSRRRAARIANLPARTKQSAPSPLWSAAALPPLFPGHPRHMTLDGDDRYHIIVKTVFGRHSEERLLRRRISFLPSPQIPSRFSASHQALHLSPAKAPYS